MMRNMRFESHELPPTSQYVKPADLNIGEIYYIVGFADPDLHEPRLTPVVFVGRDLQAQDAGHQYFQDIDSYRGGVRVTDIGDDDE